MTSNNFVQDKSLPVIDLEKLLPQAHDAAHQGRPIPPGDFVKLLAGTIGPAMRLILKPSTLRQWQRVFYQGTDPLVLLLLQANNTALINHWLNRGTRVVFLSSFPRSGNTWMRFMLSDVLLQMQGVETTTQLPVHPDNLVPEFTANSILRRRTRCPGWAYETSLAFIKTHCLFERVEEVLACGGRQRSGLQRDCRVVYVYRAPEDALVSLYHLTHRDVYSQQRARHTIDEFCRVVISDWVKSMSSYLQAADEGFPTFFLSYERLSESPVKALADMLHWLDVPNENQIAGRAVANMQFAKLQAMEIKANESRSVSHKKKLFFRRGGPGSGSVELKTSTLQEIRAQAEPWLQEAESRRIKQARAPIRCVA
jgi:hypothetical protein